MMRPLIAMVSVVALVPAMVGPARAAEGAALMLALCNGGQINVPLPNSDGTGGPPQGPCCAKGCHTGDRRKAGTGPIDGKQ